MKIKKDKILKILLMMYTFVVIYTPNFFSNAYINYMLPFVYMFVGLFFLKPIKKNHKINGVFYLLAILIAFWILAALYFLIRALIAGVEVTDIINLRLVQSASIIVTIISISKIEHQLTVWGMNPKEKLVFILNVAMIQAFFVIIMILNPSLRSNLLAHFYQYGNGNEFTMAKRVYGIMSNYTYATPIFHGILATLSLIYGITYNKKMFIYIPFLILMIALNGRTGMLVFILGVFISILYFTLRNKYMKKAIIGFVVLLILLGISLTIIKLYKIETYNFLISGIEDVIKYILYDEKEGNVAILSNNFSDNINIMTFLYGNGHKIQNKGDIPDTIEFEGEYSDMGYLNDMYMAGIVYMLLLYVPLTYFILKNVNTVKLSNEEKCINDILKIFLILVIIFCNIKGEVFRASIIIAGVIFAKLIILDKRENVNEKSISNNVNI